MMNDSIQSTRSILTATNVQTSTTQGSSLFDTDGLQAELSSFNGGNITTWTTTNNNNLLYISYNHRDEIIKN